jgi:predicted Zn finger-like uncharacterized protein
MPHEPEVLEDDSDPAAKRGKSLPWRFAELFAEQANPSPRRSLREVKKLQQRGLARARRPREKIEAAAAELEIEIAQDFGSRAVAQADAREFGDRLQSVSPLRSTGAGRLAKAHAFLFTVGLSSRKRAFAAMILTCPNCGTQYVVKDGAVPPGGRQVRCTACKHSWHQDPVTSPESEESSPATESEEPTPADEEQDESIAEATLVEPRSGPEAEERAYEETMVEEAEESSAAPAPEEETKPEPATDPYATAQFDIVKRESSAPAQTADWREPPQAEAEDDQFSPFAAPDEVAPKRRSPIVGLMIVAVLIIAIAAALWFLAPGEWRSRLGLGESGASPLALVTTHMDRQKLESGNELLTVTGRVINPTSHEQDVPPIRAQLKTRTGKVVYSWTIAPPARSLAPGASASFNSAEVNIPPGGEELTISLGSLAG